ncbi:MAG: hypothetical protein WBW46_17120 [Candidatus Sulfotelmatobacter sp.]
MSAATSIPCWFISIFWTVAFLASIFHGVYCFEVHEIKDKAKYHTAALIQQWCFNFLGSLVGWIALWFLIRRSGGLSSFLSYSLAAAGWSDFALGLVAFVGVSGYLPFATIANIRNVRELADKLTGS